MIDLTIRECAPNYYILYFGESDQMDEVDKFIYRFPDGEEREELLNLIYDSTTSLDKAIKQIIRFLEIVNEYKGFYLSD